MCRITRNNAKSPPGHSAWGAFSGARGTRTPKPFRALAFEASALPFCQRSKQRTRTLRPGGRRIRADATSGARIGHGLTGRVGLMRRDSIAALHGDKQNRGARIRTGDLCDPNAALYRTEPHPGLLGYLQKNGRGGIRTHADFRLHDFQSCALSHSATRPERPWTFKHDLKRREWDSNPRGP